MFKDVNGRFLTTALFKELSTTDKYPAMYTIEVDDIEGYKSAYKIYMAAETEYEAAKNLVGSWEHWVALTKSYAFGPYVETWREEKAQQYAALGMKGMITAAKDGNAAASKWLVERGWEPKKRAGRPKHGDEDKEQLERQKTLMTSVSATIEQLKK